MSDSLLFFPDPPKVEAPPPKPKPTRASRDLVLTPTSENYVKEFMRIFNKINAPYSFRERFSDFTIMAAASIRKLTMPSGPEADAVEAQYMAVVRRYDREHIEKFPKLLAITQLALADLDGQDFLGRCAVETMSTAKELGQFFTPSQISIMMAKMVFHDIGALLAERGFITMQEPASGAGGMILAAAHVMKEEGYNPSQDLFVEAIDINDLAFNMTYVQLACAGIPAAVNHGNTLSGEMWQRAYTPAFFAFYERHQVAFDQWMADGRQRRAQRAAELAVQAPSKAGRSRQASSKPAAPRQVEQFSFF